VVYFILTLYNVMCCLWRNKDNNNAIKISQKYDTVHGHIQDKRRIRQDSISVILHEEVCWSFCKTRQNKDTPHFTDMLIRRSPNSAHTGAVHCQGQTCQVSRIRRETDVFGLPPTRCHARCLHVTSHIRYKKNAKQRFPRVFSRKITKTTVNRCKFSVKCIERF